MIKIPEKYYVGISCDKNDGSIPLAFATPFGTDSAFNNRKATVDSWCNLGHATNAGTAVTHDNVLVEGFRISESIRRTSSWNGGNVVWRVEDPRGFELEIQSGNFANIVDCTTIVNGVIQGRCVWGREGSTNVLLPEASAPYQEAVNFTQLSKKKVSKKDLVVGQRVRMKDDTVAYYLGDYHGFAVDYNIHRDSDGYWSKTYRSGFDIKPMFMNKRSVFLNEKYLAAYDRTGDFSECRSGIFAYADIKNVAEIEDGSIVVNQQALMTEIARQIDGYGYLVFPEPASAVSTSAFKKVEFKVVDGAVDDGLWLMESPGGKIVLVRDQNFIVTNRRYMHKADPNRKLTADLLPFDAKELKIGSTYGVAEKFVSADGRASLPVDHFDDYKQKTLVAVLDDVVEAPITIKYYGRPKGITALSPLIIEDTE